MTINELAALEDVAARLDDIRAHADADDPESAHMAEDGMYRAVLRVIAAGQHPDPAGLAALALTSEAIEFPRWCA